MPTQQALAAAGHNPQNLAWVRNQAFTMRVHKCKTYAFIGRALAPYRQGKMAGVPYSPRTVFGWVKAALELEQPKDKALRQSLQKMEELRYDDLYAALVPLITPQGKKCKTCNRSPQEADPVAVGQARKVVDSRCNLLGLNEPASVAVHNATRETLDTFAEIYDKAIGDYLPAAQADGLRIFIQQRVCEATGEAPPADIVVEAKVIES